VEGLFCSVRPFISPFLRSHIYAPDGIIADPHLNAQTTTQYTNVLQNCESSLNPRAARASMKDGVGLAPAHGLTFSILVLRTFGSCYSRQRLSMVSGVGWRAPIISVFGMI